MFKNEQINLDSLPQISSVKLKPISNSYYKILFLNKIVLYTVIIGFLIGGKYITQKELFQDNFIYILGIVIVGCTLNLVLSFLSLKKRKYAIRKQDVIYARGLIVYSITTVPISRIQHIETSRSWLARQFNLSTLKIYTAGESGSDLSIKGLPKEEATQINDFLSAKVNDND